MGSAIHTVKSCSAWGNSPNIARDELGSSAGKMPEARVPAAWSNLLNLKVRWRPRTCMAGRTADECDGALQARFGQGKNPGATREPSVGLETHPFWSAGVPTHRKL